MGSTDRHLYAVFFQYLMVLLGTCFAIESKGQQIQFTHLTTENGLSQNSVLAIAQDRKGFIWMGTGFGLNRFDGRRFKTYNSESGNSHTISSNYLSALYVDKQQHLWVGSSSGLDRYNEEMDYFERITLPGRSAKSHIISSICQDRKGILWVGTWDGLYQVQNTGQQNKCQIFPFNHLLAGENIRAIFQDQAGNIWIGTTTGLTEITPKNNQYTFHTFRNEYAAANTLPGNFITALTGDGKGNIWVGTQSNGFCQYIPSLGLFRAVPQSDYASVRSIYSDKQDRLWIGTQDGLLQYIPYTGSFVRYQQDMANPGSLSQNSVYSIYQDNNGSIWVGTYFGGANIINAYNTPFYDFADYFHISSPIFNNVISGIAEDKDHNLWIGTEGGGIGKMDLATGKSTIFINVPSQSGSIGSNNIKTIFTDRDGNTWVGTHGGGLNLYIPNTGQFRHYLFNQSDPQSSFMEIAAITDDANGHLWVGSHNGLYVFNNTNGELLSSEIPIPVNLKEDYIRTIYCDKGNNIWIGSAYGIYLYETSKQRFIKISNDAPNCFAEMPQGIIWAAINHEGLSKYEYKNSQYSIAIPAKKLNGKNILGLLPAQDGKSIWISTNKGLLSYNIQNNAQRLFTPRDGIPGVDFNINSCLRLRDGMMLFGGLRGIVAFHPEQMEINALKADIEFTYFKIADSLLAPQADHKEAVLQKNISLTDKLQLKYNQNIFTIGYALLNYIKPEKNRYAYKLEGFNQDWVETSATEATFTNLPAGDYTFWVKGANNDGIWSPPIHLGITVLPPLWRTGWAYAVYLMLAGGIAFVIIRFFFLRELLKKEENLHQAKLNFFTNISHEIRTHLTLILAPLDRLMQEHPQDQGIQQQLQQTKNNASRLLKLVNELMDFRKAETENLPLHIAQYNVVPFLEELLASFQALSFNKNITAAIIYDAPIIPLYFDKDQMEKVFANILINAYKFTPENGRITIHITESEKEVTITVADNGRGISSEYIDRLFSNFFQVPDHNKQNTGYGIGLALSKKIIELHKGNIHVESHPQTATENGETRFIVALAKGKQHFDEKNLAATVKDASETLLPAIPTEAKPQTIVADRDKQYTILIVEDNSELRTLLRNAFEDTYHILEAENGEQGLQTATHDIPDVIVSDVMMPIMDGFAFCNAVKSDTKTSHIPVILLTAKNTQHDQIHGLERGADLYLTKPFSSQVLTLSVNNLLATRARIQTQLNKKFLLNVHADAKENITEENTGLQKVDLEFLQEMTKIVEENMAAPGFGVNIIARKIGMSAPILYKKLKAVTGMSVNEFVKSIRLKKALEYLQTGQYVIYEIADMVGFKDSKYFSQEFKKQFGINPREYGEKMKNTP